MAEKQPSSLIGYDPLAWLNESAQESEVHQVNQIKDANDDASTEIAEPTASIKANEESLTPLIVELESAESAPILHDEEEVASDLDMVKLSSSDEGTETESLSATNLISLQSVVNIQGVNALHKQLISALEQHQKIEIDASAVNTIDTASLQLFLVLKTTAIKQQKEVVFEFPSERFIESAQLLGVDELLDIDHAAAGFF